MDSKKTYKILKSSTYEDFYFTEAEFLDWYYGSTVRGLEPISVIFECAKDPKYANGYYIGMGYRIIYSPEKIAEPVKTETKCLHPRKYLNKISKTLEFMVCPDCKQEVKETPPGENRDWWIGM